MSNITVRQLSFSEEDILNSNSRKELLDWESDLLKLVLLTKNNVDRYKSLKEQGEPVSYNAYSKAKRFLSLLGLFHQIIKRRLSEVPKTEPHRFHFNHYFILASKQILTDKKFAKIHSLAEELQKLE